MPPAQLLRHVQVVFIWDRIVQRIRRAAVFWR